VADLSTRTIPQLRRIASSVALVDLKNFHDSQCPVCFDERMTEPTSLDCGHVFCKQCVVNSLQIKGACPVCRAPAELGDFVDNTIDEMRDSIFKTILTLRMLSSCVQTKMMALFESFRSHPPGTKSIIFCNWRREMGLVAEVLALRGDRLCVSEFHGDMSIGEREASLRAFRDATTSAALVITFSSGGEGVNLQDANRVYIMSPHWNAANELQAMARAHRIGTAHQVVTTRFIVRDTIEEYMHTVQQSKLGIASHTLCDPRIIESLPTPFEMSWDDYDGLFSCDKFDKEYVFTNAM
jgi:SNF2 family DNA or RNA helicase